MNELLGTRYRLFGCKPEFGFDCVNFCAYVYNTKKGRNVELPIKYRPKTGMYEKEVEYLIEQLESFDLKPLDGPKDYCIVVMPGDARTSANHLGIYYKGEVYHMSTSEGLINHRLDCMTNYTDFRYYE